MDERDLEIERLSNELEEAKKINGQLSDEGKALEAEIDRIKNTLFDIYRSI
jgi:septal ring factor EnvC (AmiA/AmiB activator)